MTQNLTNKTILGEPYHEPSYSMTAPSWVPRTVGVYEDTRISRIFFPAAGYTQEITYYKSHNKTMDALLQSCHGLNRQVIINNMYKYAPVGSLIHGTAELVLEPNNTYDNNAIQIMGLQADKGLPSHLMYSIGYVPARSGINKKLIANWDKLLLNTGQVSILKDSKGHLVPMVSFQYHIPILAKDNRFARLQYE
jgi:hypothetical protein